MLLMKGGERLLSFEGPDSAAAHTVKGTVSHLLHHREAWTALLDHVVPKITGAG